MRVPLKIMAMQNESYRVDFRSITLYSLYIEKIRALHGKF